MKNNGNFTLAIAIIIFIICECESAISDEKKFWESKYLYSRNYLQTKKSLADLEVYKPKKGIWKIVFKNMVINNFNSYWNKAYESYTNWHVHEYGYETKGPYLTSDVLIYYDIPSKDAPIWEEECGSSDATIEFSFPLHFHLNFNSLWNSHFLYHWWSSWSNASVTEKKNRSKKCSQQVNLDELKELLPSFLTEKSLDDQTKWDIDFLDKENNFIKYHSWKWFTTESFKTIYVQ